MFYVFTCLFIELDDVYSCRVLKAECIQVHKYTSTRVSVAQFLTSGEEMSGLFHPAEASHTNKALKGRITEAEPN